MVRKRKIKEKQPFQFYAWSDGSGDWFHPQRPGGSAYIIYSTEDGTEYKRASKGFLHTTNNRMELLAIISIVNSLPQNSSVLIHTDSQYCILALQDGNPQKNLDLVNLYKGIVEEKKLKVILTWVRGHDGDPNNEECDRMAKAEFEKKAYGQVLAVPEPKPLPPDTIVVPVDNIKPKKKRSTKKKR